MLIMSRCNFTKMCVIHIINECAALCSKNVLILDSLTVDIISYTPGFDWFEYVFVIQKNSKHDYSKEFKSSKNVFFLNVESPVKETINYVKSISLLSSPPFKTNNKVTISASEMLCIKLLAFGYSIHQIALIMEVNVNKTCSQYQSMINALGLNNLLQLQIWVNCNGLRIINKIFIT